ncbi:tetratricopeptide repeat protein [Candidatus Lokiarchaeum ossiferum]|uniref:tetratricopeptide repeat protein n=1 Tax=Candidatus Lokiarchaeum ossiferum TaxID=2951803 RepID=UPI00352FAC60
MIFTTEPDSPSETIFSGDNIIYTFIIIITFGLVWYTFKKYREQISRKTQWILSIIFLFTGIVSFIFTISLDSILFSLGAILMCALGMYMAPLKIYKKLLDVDEEEVVITPKKKKIIAINEEYEETLYQQMDREGHALYKTKKYQYAIDCFVKMLQLDPESVEAWYMLGKINLDRNRIKEARKCFIEAYKLNKEEEKVVTALREVNALVKPPQEKPKE